MAGEGNGLIIAIAQARVRAGRQDDVDAPQQRR
jgi:hypothetical protein